MQEVDCWRLCVAWHRLGTGPFLFVLLQFSGCYEENSRDLPCPSAMIFSSKEPVGLEHLVLLPLHSSLPTKCRDYTCLPPCYLKYNYFFDAYILFTIKVVKSRNWGDSSFGKVLTMQGILKEDMNLIPTILIKNLGMVAFSCSLKCWGFGSLGYSGQPIWPFSTGPFCWSLSLSL